MIIFLSIIFTLNSAQKLDPCSKKEFSCDTNTICVPMSKRCNGILDSCDDESDETDCQLVKRKVGYNNLTVPKGKNQRQLSVRTSLYISEISTIDEVNGYFTTIVDLIREWNDHNDQ